MSDQVPNPNVPKKKLKWYWWVLIVILGLSVLSKFGSQPATTVAATEATETPLKEEKPKRTPAQTDKLLEGLRKSKDEFQKTTFYYDPSSTKYNNANALYLYLGRDESDNVWPRLTIQYAGENWLFIEAYQILIDGQTRTILPEEKIKRDNSGGEVWEVVDKTPNDRDIFILGEIANSKVAKIRYEGREKVFDRVITDKEKKALKRILEIYTDI